jgi:hypothetical protein
MTTQEQLATVIIEGTRREMDRLRDDVARDLRAVHHRISEVAERVTTQNGRQDKSDDRLAALDRRIAVLEAAPPPIARREFWIGVAVLGAMGGAMLWVIEVAEAARHVLAR